MRRLSAGFCYSTSNERSQLTLCYRSLVDGFNGDIELDMWTSLSVDHFGRQIGWQKFRGLSLMLSGITFRESTIPPFALPEALLLVRFCRTIYGGTVQNF